MGRFATCQSGVGHINLSLAVVWLPQYALRKHGQMKQAKIVVIVSGRVEPPDSLRLSRQHSVGSTRWSLLLLSDPTTNLVGGNNLTNTCPWSLQVPLSCATTPPPCATCSCPQLVRPSGPVARTHHSGCWTWVLWMSGAPVSPASPSSTTTSRYGGVWERLAYLLLNACYRCNMNE